MGLPPNTVPNHGVSLLGSGETLRYRVVPKTTGSGDLTYVLRVQALVSLFILAYSLVRLVPYEKQDVAVDLDNCSRAEYTPIQFYNRNGEACQAWWFVEAHEVNH